MDAKDLQRRLVQALVVANPTASVAQDGDRVHAGDLTIEFGPDRIVVGPSTCKLTREELRSLADPDSVPWFVARFDDPDFTGKVARFLQKNRISLPTPW